MSSELSDAAEGATKAALNWSLEKIKGFAQKFRDKQLLFIEDKETIDLVRDQLGGGEWSLVQHYLKDKDLKILVQMGLTLKKLDSIKNQEGLHNLRNKIIKRYGTEGLHIAEFVQNGILNELIGSIADKANSPVDIVKTIVELLKNLEKYVVFVLFEDNIGRVIKKIETKLDANEPEFFIIFSSKSALKKGREILKELKKNLSGYEIKIREDIGKLMLFLFKKEERRI